MVRVALAKSEEEVDVDERDVDACMHASLASVERSRQLLENSEKQGVDTAQELVVQREQLERTERGLDVIERTTQMTQRNLNSLKGFFGGFFKNKFSRAPAEPPQPASISSSKSTSQLKETETVNKLKPSPSSAGQRTLNESTRNAIKGTRWEAMDNQIDENLDAMSDSLKRLQVLGTALGRELEEQDRLVDRIQEKTDRNNAVIRQQDKQMKYLLD